MRLLEITPDFVRSQTGTLLTILQHLQATMGKGREGTQSVSVPMDAISNLMNNAGYSFNYADFLDLYNNEPRIAGLVANFNQDSVDLGKILDLGAPTDKQQDDQVVDKMAKSAAKAINKKI